MAAAPRVEDGAARLEGRSARPVELVSDGAHVRLELAEQLPRAGGEPCPRAGDDRERVIERGTERRRAQALGVIGRVCVRNSDADLLDEIVDRLGEVLAEAGAHMLAGVVESRLPSTRCRLRPSGR